MKTTILGQEATKIFLEKNNIEEPIRTFLKEDQIIIPQAHGTLKVDVDKMLQSLPSEIKPVAEVIRSFYNEYSLENYREDLLYVLGQNVSVMLENMTTTATKDALLNLIKDSNANRVFLGELVKAAAKDLREATIKAIRKSCYSDAKKRQEKRSVNVQVYVIYL